ncbi:type II toxin-antitoxin system Phd/YefM family antitoxin [Terrarubrum flagellatum]|uniref:type II toxin-antitoxin system Phd/YefM family antitoxin n=1 Tax=Terrirubrum flagellatum TaxID=2895980 RepID=UPI003144FB61
MATTTLSSREFQQNANLAQRAAHTGPVIITNRGRPSHVLLTYDEYERLAGGKRSLVEALSMPGLADLEVEFPHLRDLARPADF